MIHVRSVDHIVLRVRDVEAVGQFYVDVLGARWDRRRPDIGLHHLRLGDFMIDLVPIDGKLGQAGGDAPGREGRNVDHFALRVEPWNSDDILAVLNRHEIASEVTSRYGAGGDGPSVYLQDPEGNGIELKGYPASADS